MQPLQYYLRDPDAQGNSITHAAAAPSNFDATITMRSAETELQSTKNYAQQRRQLQLENRISTPKGRKDDFEALCKRTLKGKLLAPK